MRKNMLDFPEYSSHGKYVKDIFVMDSVSTIFYFEDSRHESVYERLLKKLMPDLRPFAVVCLGGKSQLIQKAKDKRNPDVVSVFIADKDFDDLLGKIETIEGFHYLSRACLENFLLDVNALMEICIEENVEELTNDLAKRKLRDYDDYVNMLNSRYELVTRLFLVARKFNVEKLMTTKLPISELLTGADEQFPVPTEEWCFTYRRRLQDSCHGNNEWLCDDTALDAQLEIAFEPKTNGSSLANCISDHFNGKHLFRCIVRFVQSRLNVSLESLDPRSLYLRLLAHADVTNLHSLRNQLKQSHPMIVFS